MIYVACCCYQLTKIMGGAVVLDGSCQGGQLSVACGMGRISKHALRHMRSNDRCVVVTTGARIKYVEFVQPPTANWWWRMQASRGWGMGRGYHLYWGRGIPLPSRGKGVWGTPRELSQRGRN